MWRRCSPSSPLYCWTEGRGWLNRSLSYPGRRTCRAHEVGPGLSPVQTHTHQTWSHFPQESKRTVNKRQNLKSRWSQGRPGHRFSCWHMKSSFGSGSKLAAWERREGGLGDRQSRRAPSNLSSRTPSHRPRPPPIFQWDFQFCRWTRWEYH